MADYGLEVFDGEGETLIDLSSNITKVLGQFQVTIANGSYTDNRVLDLGNPFWFILNNNEILLYPTITFSSGTFTWRWLNYLPINNPYSAPTNMRRELICVYGGF